MAQDLSAALVERLSAEASRRGISVDDLIRSWLNGLTDSVRDVRDMYALTDANSDLIARFNRDLQYTYVNPSSVQMLAKPVEDILGRTFYDMSMSRELADHLTTELSVPFETGREHWCTYELQGRKRVYTYEVQMIPVFNSDAVVETVLTVSRDISPRRQAEAAVRESERRYRGIVEGQIDLVCLYRPDTTVVFVNDSYCEYFNKTREEIIGHSFLDLTDPSELSRIMRRLEEVLRDPTPKTEEYPLTDASGTVRWISWVDHGIVDDNGNVSMVQAIGRDITHMKRIEEQLEIERERYEHLFNENPLPIWVYDLATLEYLAVNDAAVNSYGYSREEFLHMKVLDIRPEEDAQRLIEFLQTKPTVGNKVVLGTWRHRRKNGDLFEAEVTGRDIIFNGRRARLIMALDITERRALEAERLYTQSLEIELQKEREVTLLKERFTSMVTHEFRTPLSIIVSTIDILKNYFHKLTKENMARKLDIVTSEANRMTALLDDVLLLGRATAGRLRVNPESLDLVEVVQGLVENLRLTDQQQHVFEVVAICENALIISDRRLLEQILINLLTNAVKYSPIGTTITAEICPAEDHVTVKVRDEGRGIPEADQPRIFEAFHRADNATGIEGSGLGLAIVKESVVVLGGDIKCKSRIGEGTTFTINLPAQAPQN